MLLSPSGDPVSRVLTAEQARTLGFSAGQVRTELRRGRWDRLVHGVYLTTGRLPTRGDWVRAGLAVGGRGAVLSGWDAVRAFGVGSNRAPVDDVLVLVPAGSHRTLGPIRLRASKRPVRRTARMVPDAGWFDVATAARAVADTALVYRTLRPVRALVTEAVQAGLCTADELADELAAGPRNRSAHLRCALDDVLIGAASIAEAEWADAMRASDLPPFELNVPILDPAGRHIATADVLWRALRAVLEVDSKRHHLLVPAWRRTMTRHNELTRFGLAVTHYPPVELTGRTDAVIGEVGLWLRARAAELGVPYRSSVAPTAPCAPNLPLRLPLPPPQDQQRDLGG